MTKNIIFGLTGLAIGAVGGFIAGKFYYKGTYEQQARDEINEMREHYENKEKELKVVSVNNVYENRLGDHTCGIFQDPAESEYPEEDDDKELDDEEEPDIGDVNLEYEKNRNKPPKIISVEETESLPAGTDSRALFLYTYDDTITDEDDNEIEQPELLVGDCLDKYDFYNSDERVLFVMNYELSTCYEISKIDAAWDGR